MTVTATGYQHIELDAKGVPIIAGTTMKVVELIMAKHAYGWSPEEIQFQHPYLTMSQIYSALGYYWDYKEELDADMKRREEYVKQAEREAGPSAIAAKLRAKGLLK